MIKENLLVREARLDGTVQTVPPLLLWQRVLVMAHHPPIAGHSGQPSMYDAPRRTSCWPQIAADVDYIVRSCTICAQNNPSYYYRRHMQPFRTSGPPESVAIDTVGPFLKTLQAHQYILVITYRYSTLTRAVSTSKTPAIHVASLITDH